MNEEKTNNMNNTPNEPNTQPGAPADFDDPFLKGNERIEEAIEQYYANPGKETLSSILETIRQPNRRGKRRKAVERGVHL